MKLRWNLRTAKRAVVGLSLSALPVVAPMALGQELRQPASERTANTSNTNATFLPYAQFEIPFNVDTTGPAPALVQLWVSTDEGTTWQMHGSTAPKTKRFDFRAASEGLYLFSVRTVDATGASFPSSGEPLRVYVDTTKPQSAVHADINGAGQLVIDVRVVDSFLNLSSAVLRVRTDRDGIWKDIPMETLVDRGDFFESQTIVNVAPCREVAIVFGIKDQANNPTEATYRLDMPRTASGEQDMMFASTGNKAKTQLVNKYPNNSLTNNTTSRGQPHAAPVDKPQLGSPNAVQAVLSPIAGATPWEPAAQTAQSPTQPKLDSAPGRLVASDNLQHDAAQLDLLQLESMDSLEELPLPAPVEQSMPSPRVQRIETVESDHSTGESFVETADSVDEPKGLASTIGQAYHCKTLAFSLDYSVEASGGAAAVSDVELWGTEDGGRSWHLWGSDPDRQSPFDVRVGNDGLFGFRMVIVGTNGIVSNRPKDGDIADVWINVDSSAPVVKITRAVYGEGLENGMLVIDYTCTDTHLVDRPVTLSFSERQEGPWTTIATGLKNTGMYLWKADPNLPEHVYLKLDVVDKAGNVGVHRLDLPIDIKGLVPRGRIQGFRPILTP